MDADFLEQITINEKRILTLLYKVGAMSKHDLTSKGQMSWATAVKMVNRLSEQGIIRQAGTAYRLPKRGKNSYVYELTGAAPLAIGVDIEYLVTSIILTNLSGEVFYQVRRDTPESPDLNEISDFLIKEITQFISESKLDMSALAGIGIGIPGISIPSWIKDPTKQRQDLGPSLEQVFNVPVVVENNVRAYAVYEKWDRNAFALDNFIFISIRTGVGSGIFINGHLYSGTQSLAGELGHFKVVEDGPACRCGGSGCLETMVNQNTLYEAYRENVVKSPVKAGSYSKNDVELVLNNLFRNASEGNVEAQKVLNVAVSYLAPCIAHLIMVLNIPHVILSGHFGSFADIMLPMLEKEVRRRILSKMDFTINYYPLDGQGFTRGAALLILKRFFAGVSEI